MSRQALLATTETSIGQMSQAQGGFPWKYIDASSINSKGKGTAKGGLKIFVNGIQSGVGSTLIDAINAISSTSTKITEINMLAQNSRSITTSRGRSSTTVIASYDASLTIWIDWTALKVQWQGTWTSLGGTPSTYQGLKDIQATGSSITMSPKTVFAGRDGNGSPSLILGTGPNRSIVKLPTFSAWANTGVWTDYPGPAINSYTITTDTGVIVSAAPTPPAETPTVEVSGIKISELNAVSSLQDDDLFVLSQDDASDGDYDRSLNVTLSDLKAGVAPDPIIHAKAYVTVGGVVSNDSNIASVNVTAGGAGQYTYEINLTTPAVAGAIVSIAPQASTIAYDANADTEYKWVTTSQLRVFTFQSNNEGLSVIVLA